MPIFEFQEGDKTFEVNAPDQARAISAFQSTRAPQNPGASSVEDGRLNTVRVNQPAAPQPPGVVEDMAKALPSGVAKGAIGLAALPETISQLWAAGGDKATEALASVLGLPPEWAEQTKQAIAAGRKQGAMSAGPGLPTFKGTKEAVESVTGPLYEPQTVPGHYAQTIGEFAPAAIGGPASLIGKTASVVVPAVASEAAGQATKGTKAEPYARFGAALVGGIGTGLATRGGAAQTLRNNLPEGVTPQMVDQAEALIQHAAGQGIQLAWPEALSQVAGRPVLTNVMRHLEASPQTEAQMGAFFGGRPQQVESAARQQFDTIAPINQKPSTIGSAVGRAADAEVNMTRKAINDAAEPYYDRSSTILLTPQEMARVRAIPGFEDARKAIRGDAQLNRYVEHLPDDSVGFLNEVKKYFDTAAKNERSGLNPAGNQQRAAGLENDAGVTRRMATLVDQVRGGGDYKTALSIESRGREQILQPLLEGYIGKLANKDQTTQQAIEALFPKKVLAHGEQEVGDAVRALNRQNPRAASDLVRAHAENTFNEARRDLQTGANQAGGAKFRAVLVGNPQQAANLEAAITALPNGAQRWEGFNRFLEVLEATGTRQGVGSRTAYNAEFNKIQSAGGVVSDALKTGANPMRTGQKFIDKYEQWKLGRNLGQLATILTDPGAANQLRAIARMSAGSAAAQSMALKLITYGDASK